MQKVWSASRERYFENARRNGLKRPYGPQDYVFIGVDPGRTLLAAGGSFVEDTKSGLLRPDRFVELKAEEGSEALFAKYGVYRDVPSATEIGNLVQRVGSAEALKRAVEIQIAATPQLVGPPVVVLVIRANGSFRWAIPGACDQASGTVPSTHR